MAAVFLLIVVALLVGAMARLVAGQSEADVLDMRAARARLAAQAALDWAAWQIRDPVASLVPDPNTIPDCFSSPKSLSLPDTLAEFSVSVHCSRDPVSPGVYSEDQRRLAIFDVEAVASYGPAGSPERVMRRVTMRIEACKDPAGDPPAYAC